MPFKSQKKCAIYCRVSTEDQKVDLQLRDLQAYAKQRELEIFQIYSDLGISGSKENRPELDALMADARKLRFKSVLVWRFDRFARSTKHLISALAEFRSLGIDFISFSENIDTSSPIGEAIFTIIGAMAQLERDIIRDRVRAGLRAAKAKGRVLGRRKTRNDEEILRLRKSGLSIRQIARQLGICKGSVQKSLAYPKPTQKTSKTA